MVLQIVTGKMKILKKQLRENISKDRLIVNEKHLRGINSIKKRHIIEKLGQKMGPSRLNFFRNMIEDPNSEDLCTSR